MMSKIYQATEDGFDAKTFHEKVDGKGVTLVIARSTPHNLVFGGFTNIPWSIAGKGFKKGRAQSCIFNIDEANKLTILKCLDGTLETYHDPETLVAFGSHANGTFSPCLMIKDKHNEVKKQVSYFSSALESSYETPKTKKKTPQHFLAGDEFVKLSEIEAFHFEKYKAEQ